jgi:hypothetical protein
MHAAAATHAGDMRYLLGFTEEERDWLEVAGVSLPPMDMSAITAGHSWALYRATYYGGIDVPQAKVLAFDCKASQASNTLLCYPQLHYLVMCDRGCSHTIHAPQCMHGNTPMHACAPPTCKPSPHAQPAPNHATDHLPSASPSMHYNISNSKLATMPTKRHTMLTCTSQSALKQSNLTHANHKPTRRPALQPADPSHKPGGPVRR